jgi:type IV pilus assembly protein PilX
MRKFNLEVSNKANKQRGLVLFIALIALVAMSLAAAALVRSVDSGTLAVGNLAFKQSAIMSAETGIARAYTYINSSGVGALETNTPADGYFAEFDDGLNFKAAATWANSKLVPVDIDDKTGNETRYILQRMCTKENVPDTEKTVYCLYGQGRSSASSNGEKNASNLCVTGCSGGSAAISYRLTVRVSGPKNTVSYLQAFIY